MPAIVRNSPTRRGPYFVVEDRHRFIARAPLPIVATARMGRTYRIGSAQRGSPEELPELQQPRRRRIDDSTREALWVVTYRAVSSPGRRTDNLSSVPARFSEGA